MTKDKYDVASADPILFALDDGPDHSANSLARLAWIKGGQKGTPADMTDKAIDAVRDELLASKKYTVKPAKESPDE